ncbi:MAG TPA: low affinity iron permease family protein [Chryseolinea sp.]
MKTKEPPLNPKMGAFEKFSVMVTNATGSTPAFIVAFTLVMVWAVTGPLFNYSEQWQLVINTGTTIITFLMVFLIQKSQNKDSLAIQLKLNELVAAHQFASNRLVNVETMTEDELKVIKKYYASLSELTKREETLQQSHSIDEAQSVHDLKKMLESGARSQKSGAGQKPGARSQKRGSRNHKPGARNQKPGARDGA